MSTNFGFAPTLDGLNNIDGDSISCSSITTNNITVNTTATVPTLGTADSSNNAASTAYVTNKINSVVGNFVTLNTNQTISSCQKTFNNSNIVFDNINAGVPSIEMKNGATSYLKINASNTGQQVYAKSNLNLFSPSTRIKPDVLATNTNGQLFINDNTAIGELSFKVYDGSVNNEINSSQGLTINPNTTFTNLPTCSVVPSSGNQLTNKTYVDNAVTTGGSSFVTLNTNQTITGTKTFSAIPQCSVIPSVTTDITNKSYVDSAITTAGTNYVTLNTNQTITAPKTFDDIVTTNLQVTFNDVASFQNGAFFDNVCPYSTVAPTGSNDLTRKNYVDSNFVDKTTTQTISGAKTFNAFSINQTAGNVDTTLNSNTQKVRLIRGTNSLDMYFTGGTAYSSVIANSLSTANLTLMAGSGASLTSIAIQPSGGLGVGPEIDFGANCYMSGPLWLDGTGSGLKSFSTNNINLYNPFSALYNPTTITWGTPSANTIIGWTNAPTNVGDSFSGTASSGATPANVGQIVLPSAGIWMVTVSFLATLGGSGAATITDRIVLVSDISVTSLSTCGPGFIYADPIDDAAGSAGARQKFSLSGIYHHVQSTGSKTLFINAIWAAGARTVTISGNYKFTRIG